MDVKKILKHVDHTLLKQTATWEDIKQICDDGLKYGCASVCIPQTYVNHAAHYVAEQQHYGFGQLPSARSSASPTATRPAASSAWRPSPPSPTARPRSTWSSTSAGSRRASTTRSFRRSTPSRSPAHGNILKVIIETCLLTDEEKIKLCEVVSNSHADYIKTSTGFAGGGATREDVALMAAHMTNGKKIKAAGGIASLQDAEDFLKLGADRLGTSRIVKAVKELEAKGEL